LHFVQVKLENAANLSRSAEKHLGGRRAEEDSNTVGCYLLKFVPDRAE
jgi:hypothetical protein